MPARASYQTHTVVRGDTLAAIARKFGSTVQAIATASGIADPNKIQVGQALLIPVKSASSAPKINPGAEKQPAAAGDSQTPIRSLTLQEYAQHWLEPPRLWFTLAAAGTLLYYFLSGRKNR